MQGGGKLCCNYCKWELLPGPLGLLRSGGVWGCWVRALGGLEHSSSCISAQKALATLQGSQGWAPAASSGAGEAVEAQAGRGAGRSQWGVLLPDGIIDP